MKAQKVGLEYEDFPYPKGIFLMKAIQYLIIMLAAVFMLAIFKPPVLWLVLFFVLFFIPLIVFGISPLLTSHRLTKRRIIIRQGWYFKVVLAVKNIEEAEPLEIGKVGIKSAPGRPTLYVTTSDHNLVSIRLKNPRRVMWVWGKKVDELVINVENRNRFIEELSERIHSLQSSPEVFD